jgi:hypothetical protein
VSSVVFFVALPLATLVSAGRLVAAGSAGVRQKIVEADSPSLPPPTLRSALGSFVLVLAATVGLLLFAR